MTPDNKKGSAKAEPKNSVSQLKSNDNIMSCADFSTRKDSENQTNNKIFRVGNDVYEKIILVAADGSKRTELKQRTRVSVTERYGNKFLETTPYYDDFCSLPSHTDYQQVIANNGNGLYNRYHRLEVTPMEGEHPTWDKLIGRFDDMSALFLDYLTILYRYPIQVLPVVCLVSRENGTGKSTVGNALGYLFGQNVSFLTQNDLNSQFNPWCGGLVAIFEEISDGKKALNTIKAMSTAKQATINEKNVKQTTVDMFLKIMIFSNNEEDFIRANEEDIRYWIIRMTPLGKEEFDPDFDEKLKREAAAFLWTLAHREISTPKASRMWFDPELIKTEALAKVVENSRSDCAKDIELWAQDMGKDFYCNVSDIAKELPKFSRAEISKALRTELKMTSKKGRYTNLTNMVVNGWYYHFTMGEAWKEECEADKDLPF